MAVRRAGDANQDSIDSIGDGAHLLPLPLAQRRHGNLAVLYCGAVLPVSVIEAIEWTGQGDGGLLCPLCSTAHRAGEPPAPMPGTGPFSDPSHSGRVAAAQTYVRHGLSILLQDGQVRLNLDDGAVAIGLPEAVAAEVAEVLVARRCLPSILVHPGVPSYQLFLVGERFPVALGWPPWVRRVASGSVLLPPSRTSYGPVRWVRPPAPGAHRTCREIDIVAALRTVRQNAVRPSERPIREMSP